MPKFVGNMPKTKFKSELLYVFDWYKKLTVVEVFKKLPKDYITLRTLYNYHARSKEAVKKAREITKGF